MNKKALAWLMVFLSTYAGCAAEVEEGGAGSPTGADDGDVSEAGLGPMKAGDVLAYGVETPHPYASDWKHAVTSPGATFVRVHLTGLSLAKGDHVTVSSPDGAQSFRYEGRGPNDDGDVWAFAIDGDTAVVELHSKSSGGHGFAIEAIGHGAIKLDQGRVRTLSHSPTPEVVCGTDGREDIACHPELSALEKPVARLLFTSGGSQFVCTGWLSAGANESTLVTNNHCFTTQTETNTVQALFNFQRSACGGSSNATSQSFAGGTFLKTNSVDRKGTKGGLDYTIITLKGSPEASFGELIPTTRAAAVGDLIYFIQHPGGNPKEVGFWEDDAHTTRCAVSAVDQTYGRSATGSQTGYGCDSEGGSSGSPILDAVTGHVIALHHFGGVTNNPCLNSGTELSAICADAGSLLNCVNN
jgi:V8-like Glu-specific endopeptidase